MQVLAHKNREPAFVPDSLTIKRENYEFVRACRLAQLGDVLGEPCEARGEPLRRAAVEEEVQRAAPMRVKRRHGPSRRRAFLLRSFELMHFFFIFHFISFHIISEINQNSFHFPPWRVGQDFRKERDIRNDGDYTLVYLVIGREKNLDEFNNYLKTSKKVISYESD